MGNTIIPAIATFAGILVALCAIVAAVMALTARIYTPPISNLDGIEPTLGGTRLFRTYQRLLLLSLITFVVSSTFNYIPLPSSQDMLRLRAYDGFGSVLLPFYGPLWLILVLAGVAARVGMFFLQLWGRRLLVATYIAAILVALLHGMLVLTPVESALATIGLLADGAILVFAFTKPLSDSFTDS